MARRGTRKARAGAEDALDADTARRLLATMWRIRSFEERVARLVRARQVFGLIHLSIGGEGVAAGVCGQLRDDDAVYSGHRAHGHALAKGAPLEGMMAELMGRASGLCRGVGGSMHLVDREHGFMGATGVVGGNLPMAAGDALAARLQGSDRVAVIFFGDGAVQAGTFAETVNLAALWELPLIFVCENNGFAEFTPRSAHTKIERVSDVVAAHDFERATVDGSDPAAVHAAFRRFLEGARSGKGPFLLECLTHRRRGHYEGDPEAYRDEVVEDEWAKLDPIVRLATQASLQEESEELHRQAEEEVERAVQSSRDAAVLTPEQTLDLVYADG